MKRSTFKIIAAVVGLLLIGCADLARKFATSDGLIDFILAISGYEQIDAYPTERVRRERAKSSPLMRERIRAVHLFSVTWANSSAPVGSARRGHMLMSLYSIPIAEISRALRLDSFHRQCQTPNVE
jgi:hypothetical protein